MNNLSNYEQRIQRQQKILQNNTEIIVGSTTALPFDIRLINTIDTTHPQVETVVENGLTSVVYKFKTGHSYFAVKKKRESIIVDNDAGQMSFINEIEIRRDLEILRKQNPEPYVCLIPTLYASLQKGVIISPWIEGACPEEFTEPLLESILNTIYNLEISGLFEWDLAPGNMLVNNKNQIMLYDFGYMHHFNPLTEYNTDGVEKDFIHGIERFESRSFFLHLLHFQNKYGLPKTLDLYQAEKKIALHYQNKKMSWLESNHAEPYIISWLEKIIQAYKTALSNRNKLKELFISETFKAYALDVYYELKGKTCLPNTLHKIKQITFYLSSNFDQIKKENLLFFGDDKFDQEELIKLYKKRFDDAVRWQIS